MALIQSGAPAQLFKRLFGLKADEGPKEIGYDFIRAVVEAGRRGEFDLLFEQGIERWSAAQFVGAGVASAHFQLQAIPRGQICVIDRLTNLSAQTISYRLAGNQGGVGSGNITFPLDQRWGVGAFVGLGWVEGDAALTGSLLGRLQASAVRDNIGWVCKDPIGSLGEFFTVWNETVAQALSVDINGYLIPAEAA